MLSNKFVDFIEFIEFVELTRVISVRRGVLPNEQR